MSADNCIAILHTKERFKATKFDENGVVYGRINMFENKIDAWRVTHTQGIDNFDWYKEKQLYMLGHYMHEVWGKSKIFYDKKEAYDYAMQLDDSIHYTEYGIVEIEATEFDLS